MKYPKLQAFAGVELRFLKKPNKQKNPQHKKGRILRADNKIS